MLRKRFARSSLCFKEMLYTLNPTEASFEHWIVQKNRQVDYGYQYKEADRRSEDEAAVDNNCVGTTSLWDKQKRCLKFGIGPKRIAQVIESLDLETHGPIKIEDGCGGVYLLGSPNQSVNDLAIFKPFDEEAHSGNLGFIREFAAYLIDDSMAGVPATGIACIPWQSNNVAKFGSIQEYIPHAESAADLGPALFNVDDIHRIGVLDIRIVNCDRHSGNMLFCKTKKKLIPIDHGLCFPSAFTSLGNASFDWLLYPSAKEPFSPEVLREIEAIDINRDVCILRSLGIGLGSVWTIWMSTKLLQICAREGKTLYEIGSMVQRQGDRSKPSVLEQLFAKSLQIVEMYKMYEFNNFWSVFEECVYSYLDGCL